MRKIITYYVNTNYTFFGDRNDIYFVLVLQRKKQNIQRKIVKRVNQFT